MKRVLKMSFAMQGGKSLTMSLEDPKANLTRAEVMTAMNAIVDGSVITYNGLDVVNADKAYIYETNTVELPDD